MTKFDLSRRIATLALTAVFSTVFVLGAVAPAETATANPVAMRTIA